jgi:hypothetical protein
VGFDTDNVVCPQNEVYNDSPQILLTGDLHGWYTDVDWQSGPPSAGLYFEVGRELFGGHVKGHPDGTFTTHRTPSATT